MFAPFLSWHGSPSIIDRRNVIFLTEPQPQRIEIHQLFAKARVGDPVTRASTSASDGGTIGMKHFEPIARTVICFVCVRPVVPQAVERCATSPSSRTQAVPGPFTTNYDQRL